MYGIRHKVTKDYLKIIGEKNHHNLVFASHCVEINYYVSGCFGFMRDILLRYTDDVGFEYSPVLSADINQNDLEVVNLLSQEIVELKELLDGYDEDELPVYVSIGKE